VSVADILAQLAQNARGQPSRGALIGQAIAGASQVPGQILADREHQAILDQQRARLAAQDARQAAGDRRQAANDARDEAARVAAQQHEAIVNAGLQAAMGESGDPYAFDAKAAFAKVTELGTPAAIQDVIAKHRANATKPVEFDPTKGSMNPDTGEVLRQPAAKVMTPAEQAQRDETARHNKETERISGITAGKAEAAQQETARHNRATEAAAAKAADPYGGQSGAVGVDLEKLPPAIRAQAQALADGTRSLDPRLANKPLGQTIINAAYTIDPTFDQGNYNARAKARADLVSPNGTGGKTIGALNTAIQHAGKLSDLIETLDNSEYGIVNRVVNPLRTAAGSTKVTNFDTVAPQLAKEIERVWRGAGGTAGEIHDLIETIGHNKGKQQQREALQQFVELAQGKLDTLERQRDSALGPTAGKSIPILFEQNQPIVDTIAQRASGKPATPGPKRIVYDMNGNVVK